MGMVVTLVCVVTLYCLILLPTAHEEERSHIVFAAARALWPSHCGSATEGEFSNMTNSLSSCIAQLICVHSVIKQCFWSQAKNS